MKTITESDWQDIQLALQNKNPLLADEIRKIKGSYDREDSKLPLGEPSLRKFTRNSEIPEDLAQEVLKDLQAFAKTSDGLSNGLGSRLVQAWKKFI